MTHALQLLAFCVTLGLLAAYCLRQDLRGSPTPIPFATLVSVDYLFFYGLFPTYSYFRPSFELAYSSTSLSVSTLAFIVISEAAMLTGYYATLGWHRRSARVSLDPDVPAADRLVGWGLLTINFIFEFAPAITKLPSVTQLERPTWLIGISLLGYALISGRLGRLETACLILLVVTKIILQTATGFLTYPVSTCILFMTILFTRKRWRLIGLLGIAATMLLVSYIPVKYAYNRLHDRVAYSAASQTEIDRGLFRPLSSLDLVARRSLHGPLLQHVIDKTPAEIPFWNGSTISMLATNLVPRIFWPEKPEERLGQKFGKIYGILHNLDNTTSWNVPWLIEFYMNFGYAGAVGCMSIAGLLLGALIRIGSIGNQMNGRRFAIATGVTFPLFHQESNVSLLAGNLLGLLLLTALAFRLSDWLSRILRPATPPTETDDAT